MQDLLDRPPVAEKKKRRYAVAKFDVEALSVAKKVAALKGVTLADYLSDSLMPVATRDLQTEVKRLSKPSKPTE